MCIVLLFSIVSIQAQSQSAETVYLKNGSVIKGKVIEMVPGKQIKVKTADGSLFVYTMEEVDRVTKEEGNNNIFKAVQPYEYDVTRFRGIVEFGYIAGDFAAPEFSLSLGYQANPYFFIGAGFGVQYFTDISKAALPIFMDMRGCFFLGKASPFLSLKMGYEALIDFPYENGGFYCSPTAGVKIMTTKSQAVNLGIGLTSIKPKGWSSDQGFTIKLGYEF